MTAAQAIRALNDAAYAAMKASRIEGPRDDVNRAALVQIATLTDALVDALKPEART